MRIVEKNLKRGVFYLLGCFSDPPEIELETDRVHSGENKEAHLTCIIHGNPQPTVRTFFLQ